MQFMVHLAAVVCEQPFRYGMLPQLVLRSGVHDQAVMFETRKALPQLQDFYDCVGMITAG